jgi:AcrR family transcriptional regulator
VHDGLVNKKRNCYCRIYRNRGGQTVSMRKSGNATPRTRGRPRSDASKQAILRAAYRLLKQRGMASVSAQEVAGQAGVSTATLYRWWTSKEALMLDAFLARVKPALAPPLEGSPLERLHQSVVRGAAWLHSKDSPVAVRLISDVQEDPVLRQLFLERFYLPRRAVNLDLVHQAIAAGELPSDTDADLLIDALTGPLYFRRIIGHAPVTEAFASELASRVLQGFKRPTGL